MAIVGSAEIIVRAVTNGVKDDIRKGLSGLDGIGDDAGNSVGNSFSKGFARGFGNNAGELLDVGRIFKEADKAREKFADLQRASFALGAGLTALGGVIGALVGGIGILIATVIAASPTLLGLVGIFAAVAVAAAVLKNVFSGVGEAIQNQIKGTNAAADAADALAAAELRVKDAKYALNELTKQQARDIAELEQRYRDSADAETDAAIAAERAERNYQASVKATEKALEGVTQAREEAKEAIQQLRFELEGGVISEKKARLEFEKARDSLQRVQDLPPNSRARREAELAFAEADLNLRRAIDKNGDLRKATAKANREGIDGNAKVVKAQETLQKSIQSQQDAEIDAAKSVRSYNKAVEARVAIENELKANSPFYEKQRRDLELADRAVEQAQKDATKATQAYNNALKTDPYINLTPSAKDFVDYIVSLTERLEALKKVLQENFFSKFTPAFKELAEIYLPILEDLLPKIATSLGIVAEKFAKVFGDPKVVAAVTKLFEEMSPIIEALGGIVANLTAAFVLLLAAFSPFLTKWLKYVEKLTEGWLETIKIKDATGELEKIFATAAAVMESLWTSLGNFLGGIGNTVKATFSEGGGGWYFLTWLETVTEKWEQFTKKGAEDGSLDKYILGLSVSFTLLLESLGLILKGFLDIAASEGFANFMTKVNESIKIFNEIGLDIANSALPAVGDFIVAFAKVTKLFFDAESIAIFFKTLAVILEGIVALLDNDVAKAIISGIGAIVAFGLAIGLLQTVFGFFGKVLLGSMANMVRLFSVIMPSGSAAAATLRGAMTALATGNIAAAAPILIVVAAIVALVAIFKLAWDNSKILRDAVKDLAEAVGGALKDGMEQIKKALGDVGASTENLREFFKKLGDFLGTYIVPFFKEVFVLAIGVVVDVIVGLIKVVKGIWDAFTSGNPTAAIKAIFDAVFGLVKSIIERIAKAFGFTISWKWLTDGLEGAINFIARGINKVSEILNKAITGFNKINPFKDVPTIPPIGVPIKLAKGGIIPATSGGVLATIGEAGRPERVEPLDPDGLSKRDRAMIAMLAGPAGGISITVNPSPGMDERELAALVSRQLAFQLRKGAA
jgi:hypothetical protein